MQPTVSNSSISPLWQDLALLQVPHADQLDDIKTHLDLILLAWEALTQLGSEAMLAAAKHLNLEETVGDRVSLWRLRQANPLRRSSGGRKKLDVEEARSLVLIICHLARQQQELIRRAVTLLEQMTLQNQNPNKTRLLGDYIDNFCNLYQDRMLEDERSTPALLTPLAQKLLIDLLFYSSEAGHRRLWLALIDSTP
jgi:hypothetical protein